MTKLTTTATAGPAATTHTKPAATKGKQPLLQTLTLYRSMVLGKPWDRFHPTSDNPHFPYTLHSCASDLDSMTLEEHVLHGWVNQRRSPYISFAGPKYRVAAIWYHLKQEYMRLTYGAQPEQAGRFALRTLHKIEVHADDITRVQSTNPKVNALTAAMDERVGKLRVRVASFEEIAVPETLKCASFAWFAATYRAWFAATDRASGPSYSLRNWTLDMESLALALQDQELMEIFGVYPPSDDEIDETEGHGSDSDSDSDSGSDSGSDSDGACASSSTSGSSGTDSNEDYEDAHYNSNRARGRRASDSSDASDVLMFDYLMKLQD